MASSRLLFFFCFIVLGLVALTVAQQQTFLFQFCDRQKGNFTRNSIYQRNLKLVLSNLISNTKVVNSGFYRASYKRNGYQVNAMALCRGDVNSVICRRCINRAKDELQQRCPNEKESFIWYDNCMLRYSYRYFFGNLEFGPWFWMYNLKKVAHAKTFYGVLLTLLNGLKNKAASGSFRRKFAVGTARVPNSQTIYALVQCTPELSKQLCSSCITKAIAELPKFYYKGGNQGGNQGGRFVAPSCNFRYEINRFYA